MVIVKYFSHLYWFLLLGGPSEVCSNVMHMHEGMLVELQLSFEPACNFCCC